jgi:hypothetical protein
MRFGSALEGNLEEFMGAELAAQRRAITRAVKEASEEIKTGWRAQIRRAGLSTRLANAVRAETYPRGRLSRGAAGLVFVRAGKQGQIGSAVAALQNLSQGAVITPGGGGRYLAIPTGYNLRQGQRQAGRQGRVIVTPEKMLADKKMTFTIRVANGALMWCIRLTTAYAKSRNGRVQTRVFRGNNHDRQLLGSGRRKRVAQMQKQGWLPMFLLVPKVQIARRLDLDAVTQRAFASLPAKLLQHLESGG